MDEKLISSFNDAAFFMRLYLLEYINHNKCYVIYHNKWKSLKKHRLLNENIPVTLVIEIQKKHWIVVHVTERADPSVNYRTAYYFDPNGKRFPTNIKAKLDFSQIRLKFFKWKKTSDINASWIYSLFAAIELGNRPFSYFAETAHLSENDENTKKFFIEISEAKLQFQKVKDKIEVCSQLFDSACTEKIPQLINYKNALLILQFVESLSLEDAAFNNVKLKEYLKEIIGNDNITVISKIRLWLLHRDKKYYIIDPDYLSEVILIRKNDDVNIIFKELGNYLANTLSKLQGKNKFQIHKEPKDILVPTINLKDDIPKENVKNQLNCYISEFIKDGFSIHKIKNPDKTMFNFIVNFLPLLITFYGSQKKVFQNLIDLRNHLVHNIYILYQTNKELPYISFQSKLRELKEYMLSFNFCSRISQELQNIKVTKVCKSTIYIALGKLEKCFQSFLVAFKEELYPQKLTSEIKNQEEKLNYLIDIIEQYLKTLPLIDNSNKISITNIKITKFNLPTEYYRFTDVQRKLVFNQFKNLIGISHSNTSTNVKAMERTIKASCLALGVSEEEFDLIHNSILNPEYLPKEELIKNILNHITIIINMQKCSNLDLEIVLKDYQNYVNGDNCFQKKCYKSVGLTAIENKLYEFEFSKVSFYMDLFTIVKNIIPVFFDLSSESILFRSLNQVLNDDKILEILANEFFDENEKLKCQILSLHVLVPLGTKLLRDGKLKFRDVNEECDFIRHCVEILLKPQFRNQYLKNLFNFKTKNKRFDIYGECFELVTNMKPSIDQRKIKFLLSLEGFQKKIIDNIKSGILMKDSVEENLALQLMEYTFQSVRRNLLSKKYQDALNHVDKRPAGLSQILKQLQEKNIIANEFMLVETKFMIAKVKLKIGVESRNEKTTETVENLNNPDKYFTDVLNILTSILPALIKVDGNTDKKLSWVLNIKSCIAYTQSLLGNHNESLKIYEEVYNELFSLRKLTDNQNSKEPMHPLTEYKALVKCSAYLSAIKLNPFELNILKILNKINFERYDLGKASDNQETKNRYFMEALRGFQRAHLIQREILGLNKKITIDSLLKVGELTLKLKDINHWKLYQKSAVLFKLPKKSSVPDKDLKTINRLRKNILNKLRQARDTNNLEK